MSELVSGLFEEDAELGITDRLLRKDVVVAPVRAGTGGDFARFLGLSNKLPEAVAHLARGAPGPAIWVFWTSPATTAGPAAPRSSTSPASASRAWWTRRSTPAARPWGAPPLSSWAWGRRCWPTGRWRWRSGWTARPSTRASSSPARWPTGSTSAGGCAFAPTPSGRRGLRRGGPGVRPGSGSTWGSAISTSGKMIDWPSVRHTRGQVVEARATQGARVLLDVDGEAVGTLPRHHAHPPGRGAALGLTRTAPRAERAPPRAPGSRRIDPPPGSHLGCLPTVPEVRRKRPRSASGRAHREILVESSRSHPPPTRPVSRVEAALDALGLAKDELPHGVFERMLDRARMPGSRLALGRYLVVGELGRGGMEGGLRGLGPRHRAPGGHQDGGARPGPRGGPRGGGGALPAGDQGGGPAEAPGHRDGLRLGPGSGPRTR
jgi:hypothetical protein